MPETAMAKIQQLTYERDTALRKLKKLQLQLTVASAKAERARLHVFAEQLKRWSEE